MNTSVLTYNRTGQLFGLLLSLNLLDSATTAYLVTMGGIEVEVNPFMQWIIIHSGYAGMIATKVAFIAMLYSAYVLCALRRMESALISIDRGLMITCGIYTILCIHNVILMGMVVRLTS